MLIDAINVHRNLGSLHQPDPRALHLHSRPPRGRRSADASIITSPFLEMFGRSPRDSGRGRRTQQPDHRHAEAAPCSTHRNPGENRERPPPPKQLRARPPQSHEKLVPAPSRDRRPAVRHPSRRGPEDSPTRARKDVRSAASMISSGPWSTPRSFSTATKTNTAKP